MQNAVRVGSISLAESRSASDESQRLHTWALAAAVCAKIRQYGLPYTPQNYKIWYVYEAGTNEALCDDLARILGAGSGITPADMDRLHAVHFPGDSAERLDDIGFGLKAEIDAVSAIAGNSIVQTRIFGACLDSASRTFPGLTANTISAIVPMLLAAVEETARANRETVEKLQLCSRQIGSLRRALDAARNDSKTDALTGLANRKALDEFFSDAIAKATALSEPLSIILIDVDHFKSFNDRYGHLIGDQVLRLVAASIRSHVKGSDLAARNGGDEFAVVLPRATAHGAKQVAEAIRRTIFGKPLKKKSNGEALGQITISIGVATLRDGLTADQMIESADQCLYAAKRAGRNCVVVAAA
jgi:diguanylate cyclase